MSKNRLLAFVFAPLLALPLAAQLGTGDTLLLDIEPGAAGSKPFPRGVIGDRLIFSTLDLAGRESVWISDGTTATTTKLIDMPVGAVSETHAVAGDTLIWDDNGKLYSSDGTPEGTGQFFDLTAQGWNFEFVLWIKPLGNSGQAVVAARQFIGNLHMFVTDGTTAGTSEFTTISHALSPRTVDDKIYFSGKLTNWGDMEPWVCDGTAAGTYEIIDLDPDDEGSQPHSFTGLHGTVYFIALGDIWTTDGTAEGTSVFFDAPGGHPTALTKWNDTLAFATATAPTGVWTSDGTLGGTQQIASATISSLTAAGPRLYYTDIANDPWELWSTDGTVGGEELVATEPYDSIFSSVGLPLGDGSLVFADDTADGVEVVRTEGNAASTTQLTDIAAGLADANPQFWRRAGANLFFAADDGVAGQEMHAITIAEAGAYHVGTFGLGCGATDAPSMTWSQTPTLGDPFGIGVEGAPSTVVSLFLSADPWFEPLGNGCAGWIKSPLYAGAFSTDATGFGEVVYSMPDLPVLAGLPFYFQAGLSTGTGPFAGLDLTNGLEVILGP